MRRGSSFLLLFSSLESDHKILIYVTRYALKLIFKCVVGAD
jgi:hypothetical protein